MALPISRCISRIKKQHSTSESEAMEASKKVLHPLQRNPDQPTEDPYPIEQQPLEPMLHPVDAFTPNQQLESESSPSPG